MHPLFLPGLVCCRRKHNMSLRKPPRNNGNRQPLEDNTTRMGDIFVNEIVLIARALRFAAERHSTQRRKGQAKEPYINHLAEVAELVAKATEGKDSNLVVAALLHDTVEDTETMPEELIAEFNSDIAQLVREVTDDKSLSNKTEKTFKLQMHRRKVHEQNC